MELLWVPNCRSTTLGVAYGSTDRLENEHLGNIDQYRVTREVPLPYAFDRGNSGDHDDDGDDSEPHTPTRSKD